MKFADAQKKMIDYLGSSEFSEREDANTTISSVPILQKIIKKGFITQNSQEGIITSGFNKETQRYYHIEERAYLMGFMKRDDAIKFVEWMNTNTNKISFIIHIDYSKEYENILDKGHDGFFSKIPVTVSNSAAKKTDIKKLYPVTTILTAYTPSMIDFTKKTVHLDKSQSVHYIVVIDPVYGRHATSAHGIYKDVIKGLESI
jgi:hypothetical protein